MRRLVYRTLGMALILGLTSCATMSSQPGWVNGELPSEYSKKDFVTAMGTADRFEAAQVAAKAELSRVFSAELKSEIALIDQESTVDGHSTASSEILVDTKISTQIELQGVEVPLHWRDSATRATSAPSTGREIATGNSIELAC